MNQAGTRRTFGTLIPVRTRSSNLRNLRNLCYNLFLFPTREPVMAQMPCESRDPQTFAVIGAAMEVHREMGCGFLECPYKDALEVEFRLRDIPFRREVELPVFYKGHRLPSFYKADFICYEDLIVEAKAIKALADIDRAQTINYLKGTGFPRALLLNFGATSLEYERLVNRFLPRPPPVPQTKTM